GIGTDRQRCPFSRMTEPEGRVIETLERQRPIQAGRDAVRGAKSANVDRMMPSGAKLDSPRRSLRPLWGLKPYVLKHPGMLVLAGFALLLAALAMLTLPIAVRRVIDFGFSGADAAFIDRYFSMLMLIGLVLAVASAARFYFVNWLGERVVADLRADVFRHLSQLGPDFYETTHSGEGTSRLTADTTQIKAAAGTAISQALRNIIML